MGRQAGERSRGEEDRMAGEASNLVLILTRIREPPEMQVDSIFGFQHNSWCGDRDPGGIRQQLKAEQRQGHGHLQLIHGKLFPNAVPCSS